MQRLPSVLMRLTKAFRAISKMFPDMFVGAGTVLTTEQVDRAIGAALSLLLVRDFALICKAYPPKTPSN